MLSTFISAAVTLAVKLLMEWIRKREADAAQREAGAAYEAAKARTDAEAQEAKARAAADAVADAPEDPNDPYLRKD